MEINIFDIDQLRARTWKAECGLTYLEITLIDSLGDEKIINLSTKSSWKEFGLAAKGINEAFL